MASDPPQTAVGLGRGEATIASSPAEPQGSGGQESAGASSSGKEAPGSGRSKVRCLRVEGFPVIPRHRSNHNSFLRGALEGIVVHGNGWGYVWESER